MKKTESMKFAAALKYRREVDSAPRLTAKGRGELAERIMTIAEKAGIPVMEDKDLATLLSMTDVGDEIPPDIYKAVAEIFAFLYRINQDVKRRPAPIKS